MERLRGEKFPGHRLQAFHFSDSLLQPIQHLWEVVKLSALLFWVKDTKCCSQLKLAGRRLRISLVLMPSFTAIIKTA